MSSAGKIVVLSDIHANLTALKAVTDHFMSHYTPNAFIVLGDIVNYGMRPNETIDFLKELSRQVELICALRGNHDDAMLNAEKHLNHFSTDRGRMALRSMSKMLSEESKTFIENRLEATGARSLIVGSKKILCVHGDINNPMWGKMESTNDVRYKDFDYVLSGHSHLPHLKEQFFKDENPEYRGAKKTIFINPGSVGQPRNHNPRAQYVYLDTESQVVHFNAVEYDVEAEMNLYTPDIDVFYKNRLKNGI